MDKDFQQQLAEAYQPLFDLMSSHGLTLLKSEMDDIINAVEKVQETIAELFRATCDAEGCNGDPVCGGMHWKKEGYWSLCSKHSDLGRTGAEMPKMKQAAIDKESKRDKTTGRLPPNI